MQTVFPKIAAVLLTMSAVAFMGLSVAAFFGRPDPVAEMQAAEIVNYRFESAAGETTTWTMTPTVGSDRNPKQHANPYAAILDAYKTEARRLDDSTKEMSDLTLQLRTRADNVRAAQQQDIAALKARVESLNREIIVADAKLLKLTQDLQDLTDSTTVVRNVVTDRRQDVMRLQHELEELRTDRFRLQENRRVLSDQLVRLSLQNQALEQRLKQLQQLLNQ